MADNAGHHPAIQVGIGGGTVALSSAVPNENVITQFYHWGHFAELGSMFGTVYIIYQLSAAIYRKVKKLKDDDE
jgi:hypothetical protein